eukprot:gene2851-4694_t
MNKKYNNFIQHNEKTDVYSSKGGSKSMSEECTLQLDFKPVMYFEVSFISLSQNASIGFAPSKPNWKSQEFCGKTDGSIGYFKNGQVFDDFKTSSATIESFNSNDTIGAYWNTNSNEIWFTRNGKKLYSAGTNFIGARSVNLSGKLLPTVTITHSSSDSFKVNYGETPFKFDISKEVPEFKIEGLKELETSDEEDVSMDLSSFINNKESSDILFETCDKKHIFGHKIILISRSEIFNEILLKSNVTKLEIPYDYNIVIKCIEYLYTGKTILTKDNWEMVLKCSDKYGIVGLRKMCFEFIVKSLNKNSVLEYMRKAQNNEFDFDATDLLERCVKFVEKKAYEIIQTPEFLGLSEDIIIMMLKNTNTCADEYDLFKSCIKWAENKKKKGDEREINEILKNISLYIRYPQLSANELVKKVKPTKICPPSLYKEALEYIVGPEYTKPDILKQLQFEARYSSFSGTTILDAKQSLLLQRWLPLSKKGWKCVYKATKDGFASSTFRSKCNGIKNTVVVIQSTNGNIFGGFAPIAWSNTGSYTHDRTSFLFSLKNQDNKPCKIDNYGTNANSTYNNSSYGPTFGGGHDLYVVNNSNTTNSSYSNLGYSYRYVGGTYGSTQAKNFLAGSYNFKTTEIEVFKMVE